MNVWMLAGSVAGVSCGGAPASSPASVAPSNQTARLEIGFSPDPVPRTTDPALQCPWAVRITVSETAGVGVTFKSYRERFFAADGSSAAADIFHDDIDGIQTRLGSTRLNPLGSTSFGAMPCQPTFAELEFTFSAVDDNHHEVSATKRVKLLP